MILLAIVLRSLGRVRALPLWVRLISGLLLGLLAIYLRTSVLDHLPSTGRDMMLLVILLSGFFYGFWPGLVTGVTIRGLSLWLYAGPPDVTMVRPWNDKGIAFFIVLAVIGAASAGRSLLLLAEEKTGEDPPGRGGLRG